MSGFDENTIVDYMIDNIQESKPEVVLTDSKTCFPGGGGEGLENFFC